MLCCLRPYCDAGAPPALARVRVPSEECETWIHTSRTNATWWRCSPTVC